MNMSARADGERFQSGANKYAAYLETPEGRLRFDLAWANLHDFLPLQAREPLCALDLEGGTGAAEVRPARLGMRPEFAAVARHAHYLFRRPDPAIEDRK
jgi:hypothetical protein